MKKEALFGKTYQELQAVVKEVGLSSFTAKQLADWLYKKGEAEIGRMTNISVKGRSLLDEKYEVGLSAPVDVQQSADGTKKYLFAVNNNCFIESVMIPDDDRATLCVSSQAGCKMGCKFCMTARQGFQYNLTAGEIANQLASVAESKQLTNVVYMGMGEPFDNIDEVLKSLEILTSDWGYAWSPKRITVSSIGIIPGLRRFLDESKCHLAISLHNPFAGERQELMPMQKAYSIEDVIALIKKYDFTHQRRVSFEYIMFDGYNDTPRHAERLAQPLKGLECRVNLIRFHPIPDSNLRSSTDDAMNRFQQYLMKKGIVTTVRASRGMDILAACGMLSTAKKKEVK
ncbi:MAG: 23S rRNA (adenine(2503)-C(2))-methyltransferase RlmN [Prevotellaceae bacterium]|jgi:23S rRNA (adenine2503-C2)-methyltransferase|nr:23S rRNA (adenine(2503)-C(2))-methyltransferase RlmN [Prevotellaceae bacterium]